MKHFLLYLPLLVFISCSVLSNKKTDTQNIPDEYDFLNDIFYDVLDIEKDKISEAILLSKKPLSFEILNESENLFFSRKYFENYVDPVIGVDSEKVKELINTLDFEYLSSQTLDVSFWKQKYIHSKIKLVNIDSNTRNSIHQLSKPTFNKNGSFGFVLFQTKCLTPLNCSGVTVKIYKRINKKWIYYVQLPISLN